MLALRHQLPLLEHQKNQPMRRSHTSHRRPHPYTVLKVDLNSIDKDIPFIVEVIAKRSAVKSRAISTSSSTLYKESKEDVVADVMDSPVSKIFGIAFQPITLLLALYLSSMGWSRMIWLQKFLKIFGKGSLAAKSKSATATGEGGSETATEELPFQTFECEVSAEYNTSKHFFVTNSYHAFLCSLVTRTAYNAPASHDNTLWYRSVEWRCDLHVAEHK